MCTNFVAIFKYLKVMKKLIFTFAVLFTSLMPNAVADDDRKLQNEIPIILIPGTNLNRSLPFLPIESYYSILSCQIITVAESGLGRVTLSVRKISTGEIWQTEFDSDVIQLCLLQIPGSSGQYSVDYTTESGLIYSGCFSIE